MISLIKNKFQDDFNYTPRETMASNWSELDDVETQDIDRERMGELMRLASMEQYPTEEEEEGNWLTNLGKRITPRNIRKSIGNIAINKAAGLSGLAGIFNPLGWASALTSQMPYRGATSGAGGYTPAQLNRMNALGGYYSEPARQQRRTQSRIENMMARRAAGEDYSATNLKNLLQQTGQEDTWQPPTPKPRVIPQTPSVIHHTGGGGNGGGGRNAGGASLSSGMTTGQHAAFRSAEGGLAGLWPRS